MLPRGAADRELREPDRLAAVADALVRGTEPARPVAVVRVVDEERQVRRPADRPPSAQRAIRLHQGVVEDLDPEAPRDVVEIVDQHAPAEEPEAAGLAREHGAAGSGRRRSLAILDRQDLEALRVLERDEGVARSRARVVHPALRSEAVPL